MANKYILILIMSFTLLGFGCSSAEEDQTSSFTELPLYELERVEVLSDQGSLILGRPVFTDIDSDGNRLVMDLSSFEIHVYDVDGTHRNSFGREGNGPGEFQQPANITFGENDSLYVSDFTRRALIVYSKEADYTWRHAYDLSFPQAEEAYPFRALMPSEAGYPIIYSVYDQDDEFPNGYLTVKVVDKNGNFIESKEKKFQQGNYIEINTGGNQMRLGIGEVASTEIASLTDGSYLQAWTATAALHHYSTGGEILKSIELDGYPVQRVTNEDLNALNESFSQFGDLRSELRTKIGETFPAFSGLRVTNDGSIWLARIVPGSNSQSWYHITSEGEPLGQLQLEDGFRLQNYDGDSLYLSGELEDGSPAILRYSIAEG
ncbi:6-bladed beta-propeller [Rhodohalobacter sp. SW132]|uniref:6-bladed beta-propeller n=1 Tax=Rhodohalobacter sp. SW132 TaxID=2293433 RepID=UPI000E232D9C|nr:6-bladed beta-propeller [Rhodohalobacter sp. SW132]REL24278.1 6-bladed beta-propeller [Rhodohalobacter sp. SW132]